MIVKISLIFWVILMEEKTEYTLVGFIVVTNLLGERGFAFLKIETDEKGFKEIEKNPRQDYLEHGGVHVDYVQFDAYRRKIIESDGVKVIIEETKPFKTIEEGEYELTREEEEALFSLDLIEVRY